MTQATSVRSGRFTHDGYQLYYEIYGEGGIPCVLVHGILLDSLINRELARRFAGAGFQVALLDLLGHGNSDKPKNPEVYRTDLYAMQVSALMDHLGFSRALVGGVSLGAITALQFSAQHPERLLGLYLEMPVMEESTTGAALLFVPQLFATRFARPLFRLVNGFLKRLPEPANETLRSVRNAAMLDPDLVRSILHGMMVGPVVPVADIRRRIGVPTLVIGHGGDFLHEYRDARRLAEQIPTARLLTAKSILELRTRPERLWQEIRKFLENVSQEATPAPARHARL